MLFVMIIYQINSGEIPEQVEVSSTGAAVSTARMGVYELMDDTWLIDPYGRGLVDRIIFISIDLVDG